MASKNPYVRKKRRPNNKGNCWSDSPYVEEAIYPGESIFCGFESSALFPSRPVGAPPIQYPLLPNMKYEVVDLLSDDSGDTVIMKYSDTESTEGIPSKDLQTSTQYLKRLRDCSNDLCPLIHFPDKKSEDCKNDILNLKNIIKEDPSDTESDESGDTVIVNFNDRCKKLDESYSSQNTNVKSCEMFEYDTVNSNSSNSNTLSGKQCMSVETTNQAMPELKNIQSLTLENSQFIKTEPLSEVTSSINNAGDHRKHGSTFSRSINVDNSVHDIPETSNLTITSNLLSAKKSESAYLQASSNVSSAEEIQSQVIEYSQLFNQNVTFTKEVSSINKLCSHGKIDGSCCSQNIDNKNVGIECDVLDNSNFTSISSLLSEKQCLPHNQHTSLHVPVTEKNKLQLIDQSNFMFKTESRTEEISSIHNLYIQRNLDGSFSSRDINVKENVIEASISTLLPVTLSKLSNPNTSSDAPFELENQPELTEHGQVLIKTERLTEETSSANYSSNHEVLNDSCCSHNINVIKDAVENYNITDNVTPFISVFPVKDEISNRHTLPYMPFVEENQPQLMEHSQFIKPESPNEDIASITTSYNRTKLDNTFNIACNSTASISSLLPVKRTKPSYQETSHMPAAKKIRPHTFACSQMFIKTEPFSVVESTVNNSCHKLPVTLDKVTLPVNSPYVMPAVEYPVPFHSSEREKGDSSNDLSQLKLIKQQMSHQNTPTDVIKGEKNLQVIIKFGTSDKGPERTVQRKAEYVTNFAKSSNVDKSSSRNEFPPLKALPNVCTSKLNSLKDTNLKFSEMSAKFLTLNINFDEKQIEDAIHYIKTKYLNVQSSDSENMSNLPKEITSTSPYVSTEELKVIMKNVSMKSTPNSLKGCQSQSDGDNENFAQQMSTLSESAESLKRQFVENDVKSLFESIAYFKKRKQ